MVQELMNAYTNNTSLLIMSVITFAIGYVRERKCNIQ